jgi:hypothetical protein
VLDEDVRTREDLGFVPVFPAHQIGRRSVLAKHFENLGVALRLSLTMTADHKAIPWLRSQHGVV